MCSLPPWSAIGRGSARYTLQGAGRMRLSHSTQHDGLQEDGGATKSKKSVLIHLALFNVDSTTSRRMGEEAKVMR